MLCLPHRRDRQAHTVSQLRRIGFDYEVVMGPRPDDPDGFNSIGRRGCYEGHLTMLERALETDADFALFAEDDLLLPRNFLKIWNSALDSLPPKWEFLQLSYMDNFYPSESAHLERLGPSLGRLHAPELLTAALNAVHRDTLEDLTDYLRRHRTSEPTLNPDGTRSRAGHDGALNDWRAERGINPLVTLPTLAEQWRSESTIMGVSGRAGDLLHNSMLFRPARALHRAQFRARYEFTTAVRSRNGWPKDSGAASLS